MADPKELIRKVRRIEIRARGLTNHLFAGEYHSAFKGRGISFSEVREYVPGDDVRLIDWKVTARFRRPFVKVFEEERELNVMLLLDVSSSFRFGTRNALKADRAAEIAAVLAFSALANNDKVGAVFFSDQVEHFVPLRKGRSHVLRIIRDILAHQPAHHNTSLKVPFEFVQKVLKRRSIIFCLSDFLTEDYERPLRILARNHDVVGIQIYDPLEERLPNAGVVHAYDAEQGAYRWVNTARADVRKAFSRHFQRYTEYFQTAFMRSGADTLRLRTDRPYVNTLLHFFKRRELRA